MKKSQLIVTILMLLVLIGPALLTRLLPVNFGAVPWYGWTSLTVLMLGLGLVYLVIDSSRNRARVKAAAAAAAREAAEHEGAIDKSHATVDLASLDPDG